MKGPVPLSDSNDGSVQYIPHPLRHLFPTHLYLPICQVLAQAPPNFKKVTVLANAATPANPWFSKLLDHLRFLELILVNFVVLFMANYLNARAFSLAALKSLQTVTSL